MDNKKFKTIILPFIKKIDLHVKAYRRSKRYDMIDKIIDMRESILDEAFLETGEEFNDIVKRYIPNFFPNSKVAKKES